MSLFSYICSLFNRKAHTKANKYLFPPETIEDSEPEEMINEVQRCILTQIKTIKPIEDRHIECRYRLYRQMILRVKAKYAVSNDKDQLATELDELLLDIIRREDKIKAQITNMANDVIKSLKAVDEEIRMANDYNYDRKNGILAISGCDKNDRACDIVFVHGLDGDAISTWCYDGNKKYFWPEWLGQDLQNAGVWSRGYNIKSINWQRFTMSLYETAKQSLDLFEAKSIGQRPLIFVCHSMGGLLVKQMIEICDSKNIPDGWKAIRKNTKGIIFLSTPHLGSEIASKLHKVGVFLRTTGAIENLQNHNERLRQLNNWFKDNIDTTNTRVLVYCEGKPTAGLGIIVDYDSAAVPLAGVQVIPMDDDHITICKLQSKEDQRYLQIRKCIMEILEEQQKNKNMSPDDKA
jgi:hypothetical protein